jgi:hypothetical protein
MLFFSATPLSECDVASILAQEPGGYWLPGESRGVIDTDDSTVYIDLANDMSSEALGLVADLEQQIVHRLGEPWSGVLLIHISHTHTGSTESAIHFLSEIRNTRGGVIIDGDSMVA